MLKFPLLNMYRIAAIILALIVLIGGVISAASTASQFGRNSDIGIFITAFIPFLAVAFFLGVLSEMISLALRIEDHLDVMRAAQEPSTKTVVNRTPAPTLEPIQATVRVERTSIRPDPGARGANGTLNIGQTVLVHSRNIDSRWVDIDGEGQSWVLVEHLDIQGDIRNLPVASNRQ